MRQAMESVTRSITVDPAPTAVLLSAVLLRSAPAPMAVLKLVSALLLSDNKPNRSIVRAAAEAQKRVLPFCRVRLRDSHRQAAD